MKKAVIFLADGFEEIEALTVVDVLRRGNIDVKTVSIMSSLHVTGAHDIKVIADMLFDDEYIETADMVILPGGGVGTENLRNSEEVIGTVQNFYSNGKYVAAICAAPSVLGLMGILDGLTAVCYPGFELKLVGATIGKDNVVIDNNIITSKGPGTASEFALTLLSLLADVSVADTVKKGMLL
ncbi:MAG: DJ-1/PfpI family protein [Firmicutes bacterium]|nr:DJ-1/PfpI family protein [Bacillota bacterium]